MENINILHVASLVGRSSFGIGSSVLGLVSDQYKLGYKISVCSSDRREEARSLEKLYDLPEATIRSFKCIGPHRFACSPGMKKFILENICNYDIVHLHGIWQYTSLILNRWRYKSKSPTIIAAHGSLDNWVLRRSRLKKCMAFWLYERRNLSRASCLHALSFNEAKAYRSIGLKNHIAIIPNGISKRWLSVKGDAEKFKKKYLIPNEYRILLFLGRITPKKGLCMLIQAMKSLRDDLDGWLLLIAGADERGYKGEVEFLVRKLNMQSYVKFIGPVFEEDKRDALEASNLLVLPSFSEGAPMVILEALGANVPVLTTKASPWEELVINKCGWWTEISVKGIVMALKEAITMKPEALKLMGTNGRNLVTERYTWDKIAKKSIQLYKWLLGDADKPEFVILGER